MNGAEALIRTAADVGVDVCFANPGTTELPLVSALDAEPRVRPVLTLFEGVATGAADGYARVADRPALALLHLGPGLANGAASLHNARRAASPVVTVVGDHATWHLPADPPLASDIAGLARPVSVWVRESAGPGDLPRDVAEAIAAATGAPGPATLVAPADAQWETVGEYDPAKPPAAAAPPEVSDSAVEASARALCGSRPAALLLGGVATGEEGLRAAGRIAAASGCDVVLETFPARLEHGGDLPAFDKLGYFPELATERLPTDGDLVLAGAREPVAFFGYPGTPSSEVPDGSEITTLATYHEDAVAALEALAERVTGGREAGGSGAVPGRASLPPLPSGALDAAGLAAAVAAVQPEGAVVVDEGVTSTRDYLAASAASPRHTYLANSGGAIGHGLPLATGAAVAAPDRPVIALEADGSGMYTVQTLWTQAREGLDVTTVVCANRSYRILQAEMMRSGTTPGPAASGLTDLGHPPLDWVSLAAGMGVPGRRVSTADDLVAALRQALVEPGPHLVEAVMETT